VEREAAEFARRHGVWALGIAADVSKKEDIDRTVERVAGFFASLDIFALKSRIIGHLLARERRRPGVTLAQTRTAGARATGKLRSGKDLGMGNARFERAAFGSGGQRSIQLS
jgi:NAD(P)-dependent dehydrogenase (short-subunit alcohol dehydrogenase family)